MCRQQQNYSSGEKKKPEEDPQTGVERINLDAIDGIIIAKLSGCVIKGEYTRM